MAKKEKKEETPKKEKKQKGTSAKTNKKTVVNVDDTKTTEDDKVEESSFVDEILGEYKPIEIKVEYDDQKEDDAVDKKSTDTESDFKTDFPYSGDTNANDAIISDENIEPTKEDNIESPKEEKTNTVENKKEEVVKKKPKKKKLSLAMFRSVFGFYWNGTSMD